MSTVSQLHNAEELRSVIAARPDCAILESAPGFGVLGRHSLYACNPLATFQARGSKWTLTPSWPGERPTAVDPFDALRQLLSQTRCPASSAATPFAGGWIGYIGYDSAQLIERLPRRHPHSGSLPDIHLSYYDTFAVHHLSDDRIEIRAHDRFDRPSGVLADRLSVFRETLLGATQAAGAMDDNGRHSLVSRPPRSDFSPDEYCWAIERILEYLRAGDIFQANFTHRFQAPFTGTVPELYHRCRHLSPAPFGALLRHGYWAVVSTSPERFLEVTPAGDVETRPIKGTRIRGADQIHDLLLREDLVTSAKDHAELTMIVDLERNDLGRVCEFGSVRVTGHAEIESYSNVHHLASTVRGHLRPGCDVIDLLRATFPGGSITGAPKIRAMQIIDELERCNRGVYTGAIGYFSDSGRVDLNIAIRTLVVDKRQVHYHVGGGIVVDSDPLSEYRETLAKGLRMREALLGTG